MFLYKPRHYGITNVMKIRNTIILKLNKIFITFTNEIKLIISETENVTWYDAQISDKI